MNIKFVNANHEISENKTLIQITTKMAFRKPASKEFRILSYIFTLIFSGEYFDENSVKPYTIIPFFRTSM